MKTIVATIANQKGGVGKSTTAANFAAELALQGYRTLIIDGDPQANTTEIFLDPVIVQVSLADVLLSGEAISSKRMTTEIENLDIVPATLQLANFDRENALAVTKLRTALRDVATDYDFIIIDTPPNFGLLLTAALTAATHVIIPVQSAPAAISGLRDLLSVIETARELNEPLSILGVVCTMFDKRTSVAAASFQALAEMFPNKVFETIIHRQTKLEECPSLHRPIQLHAPNSRGADNYADFTSEVLERLQIKNTNHLRVVND